MNQITQSDKNDTILYLNRIRIFASLLVVLLHVSGFFFYDYPVNSYAWIISTFYNCLSRIAVPLFVMIGGAIYLNENKQVEMKKLFLTIVRFIVIFFIWDILYIYFNYFITNHQRFTFFALIDLLKYIINYKQHLWYLLSYIVLLALTPIIRLVCKKENKAQVKYLIILFFVGTSIIGAIDNIVNMIDSSFVLVKGLKYIFSVINLVNFGKMSSLIILFISGWYFSTFDFQNNKKTICILKWLIGMAAPIFTILLCFGVGKDGFSFITEYYYFPNYILSVCVFLTFRYSVFANKEHKLLDAISKNSFCIYLVHMLFIESIILMFRNLFVYCNSLLMILIIPVSTIVVYLLSLLLSMLINCLPPKIKKWIC